MAQRHSLSRLTVAAVPAGIALALAVLSPRHSWRTAVTRR